MNWRILLKRHTLLVAAVLFSCNALAAALTDFKALALSGDRTQLELTFDGPAPTPIGYSIENPARISLDFKGAESRLENKYYQIGAGNTRNAAIVSSGNRTRVVISLTTLVPYASTVEGNTVRIVIGEGAEELLGEIEGSTPEIPDNVESESGLLLAESAETQGEVQQMTSAAPSTGSRASELVNVDFRRSEQGTGQVVLEFSDASARTDVIERGNTIRVEVEDLEVPSELRRRLDVVDFATSVHYINVYREDGNAIVELELDGAYEYLAYQTNNQMTVDVQTVSPEEVEARLRDKFPYSGEKLSLSFQDIEVRNVLQLIADYVGLNLVASDSVEGNITLRLQNVPWDQALDIVLKTKGLAKRENGNVLLVAPAAEIAQRERQELESQAQVERLAPLVTDFIQVNYAKAANIKGILESGSASNDDSEDESNNGSTLSFDQDGRLIPLGAGQGNESSQASGFLSSRGTVAVDERTNTLIVRDTADSLQHIREALQIFDVPVRQVLIEARVVAARASVGKQLGIRWGGNINSGSGYPPVVASGSLNETSSIGADLYNSSGTSYVTSYPDALAVNLPVDDPGASSFAIGVTAFNYALDLELSALETSGQAEVVSQPKIVTSDGEEAYVISGQSIPTSRTSVDATGMRSVETEYKDVGLSLRVTPQITPDNRFVLALEVNQDSISASSSQSAGLVIDTNRVLTNVLVNNGETLVLGGVFRTEKVTSVDKTPLLGDLPLIGSLFKRTSTSEEKTELLIFITPKLVREGLANN